MRHLLLILAALLLCSAPLHAQTLKSLMYNTTNGQVVANTGTNNLTFNDSVTFEGGINITDVFAYGFETLPNTAIQISDDGIDFNTTNAASNTRTNLGLGLPALTNTSNVTMMRALAGSTNTNAPYTGIFDFLNGDSISVSVAISNGIIVSIE